MWEKLKSGNRVGIVAPSSPFEEKELENGLKWLEKCGLVPVLGNFIFKKERFLAGSDQDRAFDVMAFFKDKSVAAIFCARGGYGSPRILNLLDYEIIKKNPKPVIGFSDQTALQIAIYAQTGLVSLSGLLLKSDFKTNNLAVNTEKSFLKAIKLEDYVINAGQTLVGGNAEGKIVCGCLSLIVSLLGTPYFPDLQKTILVIEDVGEEPYKIDRMLNQLRLAGVFDKIAGLVFGEFKNCIAKDASDGTIEEVIIENVKHIQKPVLMNFPYTHNDNRYILPIGANAKLDTNEKTLAIIF